MLRKGSNQYQPRYKQRYGRSLAILVILYLLIQIGIFGTQELKSRLLVAFASESLVAQVNFNYSKVSAENQDLKDQLDVSTKIETSDTTRAVSNEYIRKYFPQSEWNNAYKITKCESNQNNMATNWHNKNGSIDRGLWMINSVHDKQFKQVTGMDYQTGAYDWDASTKFAKWIYDHSSWTPWVCSKVL